MKRFFVISILLLMLGTVYADGPRYRFKSRRALQSLWRKEMMENPQKYNTKGKTRQLNPGERMGEGLYGRENDLRYGVVVSNPFATTNFDKIVITDDDEDDDEEENGGTSRRSKIDKKVVKKGGTTDDNIFKPYVPPGSTVNPFVTGQVDTKSGQGYLEPPVPVGDGLPILLLLTASLIAIKKRLSSK